MRYAISILLLCWVGPALAQSLSASGQAGMAGAGSVGPLVPQYLYHAPSFPSPSPANPLVTSSNLGSLGASGTGNINVSASISDWPGSGFVKIYSGAGTGGSFEISNFNKVSGSVLSIGPRDANGTITPSNGGSVQLWSQIDNLYANTTSSDIGALGGHGTGVVTVGNVAGWPQSGYLQIFAGSSGLASSFEMAHYTKVDATHINIDERDPGGPITPVNGATLSLYVHLIRWTTAGHTSFAVTGDGRVGIGDSPTSYQFQAFGAYGLISGTTAPIQIDNSGNLILSNVSIFSFAGDLNGGLGRAHFGNYDLNDSGSYLSRGLWGQTKDAGLNFPAAAAARITDGDFSSTTRIGSLQYSDPQVSKTTNYQIVKLDGGNAFNNIGAAGEVDFTLPSSANTYVGMVASFDVAVAQTLKVIAGTGVTIQIGASASSSGGSVSANQVGAHIRLKALTPTLWISLEHEGTWTPA